MAKWEIDLTSDKTSKMIFDNNAWYKTTIKPEWIEQGEKEAEQLKENYGYKTVDIYKNRDVIGVLGREIFKEYNEKNGIGADIFEYQEGQYGDDGDLTLGGFTGDIKTKFSREYDFRLRSNSATVFEHHIEKPMDFYVFTGWVQSENVGYIFGWCPKTYFDQYAYHIPRGTTIGQWIAKGSYELELQRLLPISDLTAENLQHLLKG